MVGKYANLSDILSVLQAYTVGFVQALLHASVAHNRKLVMEWVSAEDLEGDCSKENTDAYKATWGLLKGANRVVVLRGFGDKGVHGKFFATKYARENNVLYLGIFLGIQIAVIEFARSILGLYNAIIA
ncbi:hypothetical protein RJT34_01512 [Clitoria ternatea]|uniref:CTP synthase (glutamine hydrolyzing) n=1 Tax=Clitoria ternatea TaxID=43366 RepID=A0AAN9Q0J7_CLITE